tara:strand:+ start:440 stop:985 length:546 start_codon:yes stop_codon:yes gene_type:complete
MSTLHVENLKGLSSGSNANKIIVPSGQTLVPSAGQVIQKVHHTWNSDTVASSNSSWTDVGNSSLSFTPKLSTSRLFITAHYHMNAYSSGGSFAGGMARLVHDGTALDYTSQHYEFYYEVATGSTNANMHARQSKCMTVASGSTNARTIKLQLIKYGTATTSAQVNQGAYYYSTIIVEEVVQ